MKYLLITLSLIVTLGSCTRASADEGMIGARDSLNLGFWNGSFTQEGYGNQVSVSSDLSGGGSLRLGLIFAHLIFAEYSLTYLGALSTGATVAAYDSFIGGDIGVSVPVLPVEIYFGVERGNYLFPHADQSFGGNAYKIGASFTLARSDTLSVGAVGEFRRQVITSDSGGDIPTQFTTGDDVYFFGLTFQFRN